MDAPRLIAEDRDFLVAYKPHHMHGAPLADGETGTLLSWAASLHPEVLEVRGRKAVEGGLLHRLDSDTEGVMLIARTQGFYDAISRQQERGAFLKTYEACCALSGPSSLAGFPPAPSWDGFTPFTVESAFRAFGPGRKAVRPVTDFDGSPLYRTEITGSEPIDAGPVASSPATVSRRFSVRLARGFRHQIRCHLAWLGWPILGDPLYSPEGLPVNRDLALKATALTFLDPETLSLRSFSLEI